MPLKLLIRKEYKNHWEKRTPLCPAAVGQLVDQGFPVWLEISPDRIYPSNAYAEAGATIVADDSVGEVVIGIKEPPLEIVRQGQVHIAFTHTIKGQDYNMPLLRAFLDRECTLIDYEVMTNEKKARIIAFGRYAGIAGALDTLHVAGKKWSSSVHSSSLSAVEMTHTYGDIQHLEAALRHLSTAFLQERRGIVIVGTGNVGMGAKEVLDWLGLPQISPQELRDGNLPTTSWYCQLATNDIVRAKDGSAYDRQEYRTHGAIRYESCFTDYLGPIDILLQTSYWDHQYPKQLSREALAIHADRLPSIIGDISCDIDGSLGCTLKATTIEEPAMTYLPRESRLIEGIADGGPTIMSIDHLPCELSADASAHFSRHLLPFMPSILNMDQSKPLEECGLPSEMVAATVVYRGKLTSKFAYLQEFLDQAEVSNHS